METESWIILSLPDHDVYASRGFWVVEQLFHAMLETVFWIYLWLFVDNGLQLLVIDVLISFWRLIYYEEKNIYRFVVVGFQRVLFWVSYKFKYYNDEWVNQRVVQGFSLERLVVERIRLFDGESMLFPGERTSTFDFSYPLVANASFLFWDWS